MTRSKALSAKRFIVFACIVFCGFLFEKPVRAGNADPSKIINTSALKNRFESLFIPEMVSPLTSIYVRNAKLRADDAAQNDNFGFSVAISGNTAVISAPFDYVNASNQGSVYIYYRDGDTWAFQQKITASDGAANDNFGYSVDIDGDTIVVGAPFARTNGLESSGSAYIFTRTSSVWTEQPKLTNQADYIGDNFSGDYFGYAVAIDGERVVVSARNDDTRDDNSSARNGSVSVFQRTGTVWSSLTKIRGVNFATGFLSQFGESVGISGTTVIIGAPNAPTNSGAVYIYTPGVPEWVSQRLDGNAAGSGFGNSVAVDDDTAVIGASVIGKAYVSTLGTTWGSPVQLTSSIGGDFSGSFGQSVSIDGDMLIVGGPTTTRGSAYIFRRINNSWAYKAQLFQKDIPSGTTDCFGTSIRVDGNKIIGGAPCDGLSGGLNSSGATSIFVNVPRRQFDFDGNNAADISVFRPSNTSWYIQTPTSYSVTSFGSATDKIAPADYDGDGKTDIAVYRPSDQTWYISGTTQGYYYVQFGAANDIPVPNDFDGDGKADLAVFRPSDNNWYIQTATSYSVTNFGASADIPVPADYDGDGKTDIAVYRPSTFTWYVSGTTQGFYYYTDPSGVTGDIPVPNDFDADGKADLTVFRPSNSTWYRINSSDATSVSTTWGATGDIPVAADYDGDGDADIAVFRPSENNWYIRNIGTVSFGTSTDKPVPAAFLP